MTGDRVFQSFLEAQGELGAELAANSDVLSLYPLGHASGAARRYVARYSCPGVVRNAAGEIATAADDFTVGITLSDDHLRHVDPLTVITWLTPFNVVHPNISPPYVCCGRLWPGIELVDLLLHVYDLI